MIGLALLSRHLHLASVFLSRRVAAQDGEDKYCCCDCVSKKRKVLLWFEVSCCFAAPFFSHHQKNYSLQTPQEHLYSGFTRPTCIAISFCFQKSCFLLSLFLVLFYLKKLVLKPYRSENRGNQQRMNANLWFQMIFEDNKENVRKLQVLVYASVRPGISACISYCHQQKKQRRKPQGCTYIQYSQATTKKFWSISERNYWWTYVPVNFLGKASPKGGTEKWKKVSKERQLSLTNCIWAQTKA